MRRLRLWFTRWSVLPTPVETAWAPHYGEDQLRQVRAAASEARLAGLRASAEATDAAFSHAPGEDT